jgi:hypothetical protein
MRCARCFTKPPDVFSPMSNPSTPLPASPHAVEFPSPIAALPKAVEGLSTATNVGGDGDFAPLEAIAAGVRGGNELAQFFLVALLCAVRGIVAPSEVLLRRNFGERYFNLSVVLGVFLATAIAKALTDLGPIFVYGPLVVFFVLMIVNQWVCFFRDREGGYWHSYSEGQPWISIPELDTYFAERNFTFEPVKLFVEPLVLLLAGLAAKLFLPDYRIMLGGVFRVEIPPLALYFLCVAPVYFFYQRYCYKYRRQLILNEKDAEIIAEVRALARAPIAKPGVLQHRGVAFVSIAGLKKPWKA